MKNRFQTLSKAGLVAAVIASTAACMIGEATHSLYLEPSGAVTWFAIERDARSDRQDRGERADEETAYLSAARHAGQPVAEALGALGAESVRVDVLRDVRPFVVATEARFERVDVLTRELLDRLGFDARVELIRQGTLRRLEVSFDPGAETDDGDDRVMALVEPVDAYRLVLTEGAFAYAVGFDLDQDCTEAVLDPEVLEGEGEGLVTLILAWHERPSHERPSV